MKLPAQAVGAPGGAVADTMLREHARNKWNTTEVLAWALSAHARPVGRQMRLAYETIVPAPLEQAFAFFSDAANLQRLTPPWLNFTILTPMPAAMREGLELDYRIRIYGVPIPWRSRIDVWEPGVRFADRQLAGPYRWWYHEHVFETAPGGTRVIDRVEFAPRAPWISGRLVLRDVERIFAYRQHALRKVFGAPVPTPDHQRRFRTLPSARGGG